VKNPKSQKTSSKKEQEEFDLEEMLRSSPDFYDKHLKGAPNLKAVKALFRKDK